MGSTRCDLSVLSCLCLLFSVFMQGKMRKGKKHWVQLDFSKQEKVSQVKLTPPVQQLNSASPQMVQNANGRGSPEPNFPPNTHLHSCPHPQGNNNIKGAQNAPNLDTISRSYAPTNMRVGSTPGSGPVGLFSDFSEAPTRKASPRTEAEHPALLTKHAEKRQCFHDFI